MIRLIFIIIVFAMFLCFIVLNLEHKSDVSLGFRNFTDIPVFLSALVSFTMGMIVAVPLVFSVSRRKKKKAIQEAAQAEVVAPKKARFSLRKKGSQGDVPELQSTSSDQDYIKKEDSPYGID